LEADPADIAVALVLPEGAAIVPGSAILTLSATRAVADRQTTQNYMLADAKGSDGSDIYAISQSDLDAFRTQQSMIAQWKAEEPDGTKGSLSVQLAGCKLGDGPSEDATLSINIRTERDGGFFPLVRDAPLAEALGLAGLDGLQPCETAG
jgi:hypothetical protein